MKRIIICLFVASVCYGQQLGPTVKRITTLTPGTVSLVATQTIANACISTCVQNIGSNWAYVWGGLSNEPAGGYWLAPNGGTVCVSFERVFDNRNWWGTASNGNTVVSSIREVKIQ